MENLTEKDVQNLLEYFSKVTYSAKDCDDEAEAVLQKCISLVSLDYTYFLVNNSNGELSSHYPSQIIVLEHELNREQGSFNMKSATSEASLYSETIYESHYDQVKLKDVFSKAKFARCRGRFCVPVILYHGKHICRSATLSGGPEIYGRSGIDFFFGSDNGVEQESCDEIPVPTNQSEWQLFDKVRSQDIRLLKTLNVVTIVDLMVEKKKVKFGMNITSSEKVDKENRYSDFNIVSLPYPGCEFFKEYRDAGYTGEGLVFDWSQSFVDAHLGLPDDSVTAALSLPWSDYKCWDLIQLTQNYMKLLLLHIQESPGGLLVHCISGWDRTPLFISLMRLSLWADGLAHQSLSAVEILYLTIAYDWMLFGHNLQDRLTKGEEIMFFCFYFLKFICGEEYSVVCRQKSPRQTVLRTDSDCLLDCVLLENENHISRKGSTTSLNSCSSSVSCKSQETPPVFFNVSQDQYDDHVGIRGNHINSNASGNIASTSSATKVKESSVAVPVPKPLRNRHESASSLSCGSWQIISGTGSLRGSTSSSSQSKGSLVNWS